MSKNNYKNKEDNIEKTFTGTNQGKTKNDKSVEDSKNKIEENAKIKESMISTESKDVESNDGNNKSTDVELDENGEEIVIIRKKERNPIIKFIVGFLVFLVVAYVTLFAIGFTMGLMRIKPPTIDENVWQNKWSEVTGNDKEAPDELEPANKESEKTDTSNEWILSSGFVKIS